MKSFKCEDMQRIGEDSEMSSAIIICIAFEEHNKIQKVYISE